MRTIIGVMGGGEVGSATRGLARQLGRYIANPGTRGAMPTGVTRP
jgi:hypothetical protein